MSRTALVTASALAVVAVLLPAGVAQGQPVQVPAARSTTLIVSWPATALPWNTVAYVTAQVIPAQPGRIVRLDLWGMGGPGWSRLDRKATDASGTVRLQLFTLCPDSTCAAVRDRYRVVVLPSAGLADAQATGTVRVVP